MESGRLVQPEGKPLPITSLTVHRPGQLKSVSAKGRAILKTVRWKADVPWAFLLVPLFRLTDSPCTLGLPAHLRDGAPVPTLPISLGNDWDNLGLAPCDHLYGYDKWNTLIWAVAACLLYHIAERWMDAKCYNTRGEMNSRMMTLIRKLQKAQQMAFVLNQ